MDCAEFEGTLADYLDGTLSQSERGAVELHLADCESCRVFLEDVNGGAAFLERIPEVEPPPALITRIAYQAPLGKVRDAFDRESFWNRFSAKWLRPVLQPRLVMGMAMTVLSFAMLERCTGVRVQHVQSADLNPMRVWDGIEDKTFRVKDRMVKYYENLRVVYELEARLRDMQKQQDAAESTQQNSSKKSADGKQGAKEDKK